MTHINGNETIFSMKILLSVLILIFGLQLFTKADDVSDFEIEGISVGDSALSYFSKDELEDRKKIGFVYEDKTFYSATYYNKPFFNFYDAVQLHLKANDNNYIIYSLAGRLLFEDNYDGCINQMETVLKDLKNTFDGARLIDAGVDSWVNSKGKNVKAKSYYFILKTGDEVSIECYDQPPSSTIIDNLNISIDSYEFAKWLHNE